MEFESPDVEKEFPGLYASESGKKSNESDFSDEAHERVSKKDLLIGKRKDKKDAKKDLRYATLEGESSPEEEADVKSPSKIKKLKPFKFPSAKKEKREKSREKDAKEKESDKDKDKKKDSDKEKEKKKEKDKSKVKLKEKKKLKHGEESFEIAEEQPIFGVPLAVAVERNRCHDGVEIPLVVRECIDHIQEVGLNTEGLYKVSGKSKVQSLRRHYNQREQVNLADYDVPVATSLLKTFLRELPEPMLTAELLPRFEEAASLKDVTTRGAELKALVDKLPLCNRQLLAWLIKHFDSVTSHDKSNKMNAQNIAATMSPIVQASQRLIAALVCHCDALFPDCKLIKYIPPLSCGSPSLPETREAITEELCKQESLLGQLHSEVQAGLCTKDREEQLWEVQRIITQLKRKLRTLERAAESTQRSIEEPDCGRTEEELNLNLQSQPSSIQPRLNLQPQSSSLQPQSSSLQTQSSSLQTQSSSLQTQSSSLQPQSSSLQPQSSSLQTQSSPVSQTSSLPSQMQPTLQSTNKHVIEAVVERPALAAYSADSIEIQAVEKSWLAKKEEMALSIETDELMNLARTLQALIENEKAEVALLRSNIRALGGNPVHSAQLESSCGEVTSFETNRETAMLQSQKQALSAALIEERLACVNVRVQIRLAQMAKG